MKTFAEKPLQATQNNALLKISTPEIFGKVAVLFGGRSSERVISLESGKACFEALIRRGVDAHAIDPDEDLALKLKSGNYDRAFIMLHGKEGRVDILDRGRRDRLTNGMPG